MESKTNVYSLDLLENDLTFEQVIEQNEEKIKNLIHGMTGDFHLAQDLTQEAFIKAFQSRQSFNGKSKFSTWLYRIAVNLTIDYQRKNSVRKEVASEEPEQCTNSTTYSPEPDQACQKSAVREILFKAIAQLPIQQREVFVLREINGCSTKEVSEILGCSIENTKWRLHKARSSLRKILQSDVKYKDLGIFTLGSSGIN
ncbi:MAG TPA: RNA polymerase sigma factor [Candidatus Deferrimicrobium sp.]|nr:RNA polymerase sigma factor [Candidatus Deferrimicrobium sp.]